MRNKKICLITNDGKKFVFAKEHLAEIHIPNVELPKGRINLRIKHNKAENIVEEMLGI